MSKQSKIDVERAAFEAWRLEKFCGGAERLKKCSNAPDVYYYSAEQEAWKVWQARASLPVGVPDVDALSNFIRQVDGDNRMGAGALAERICDWIAAAPTVKESLSVAGVPDAWKNMDATFVVDHIRRTSVFDADLIGQMLEYAINGGAPAAPTVKAEQVDMADAYVGAREDMSIWKRRALEAEQKVRHQEQIIDHLTLEAQGETRFGEPSLPSAEPVAVIEYAGYDPANSIKWLNKGLQYMQPGTLLYAQAPSLPAAGSAEWIEHGPSKACPFSSPYTSKVDVRLRDGTERLGDLACNTMWFWYEHDPKPYDVVAYRIAALSAQQSAPAYGSYTTRPAEAVAGIALRQLGDESRWVEIRDLNAHAFPGIGPHDYYPVGTVLRMPADQQSAPERVSDAALDALERAIEALRHKSAFSDDDFAHIRALFASHGRREA